MCVLCVKPAGAKMFSFDDLKAMYNRNPHGCGFATPTRTFKSLNFAKFMHELNKVDDSEPCIIHFRYATHGSIKNDNCHPFEAKLDNGEMVKFAHNGVLSINAVGDMTDSETAFRYRFIPVANACGVFSKQFDGVVERIIGGSKFAFLHGSEIKTYGHFYSYKGCLCSNMYWYNRPSIYDTYYHVRRDYSLAL